MNIIFGNLGNETIALMEWAHQQQLPEVTVVFVKTGWMADQWQQRIDAARALAQRYQFQFHAINSKPDFATLMQERGAFPDTKFQWCAGFLKGLPLMAWLDQHDVQAEAVILLGLHRNLRAQKQLPEYTLESEYFGGRTVWHPVYQHTIAQLQALVHAADMAWLPHRALECDPCVNSTCADFQRLSTEDIAKTQALEQELGRAMFSGAAGDNGIEHIVQWAQRQPSAAATADQFDMGCGSQYGCGI